MPCTLTRSGSSRTRTEHHAVDSGAALPNAHRAIRLSAQNRTGVCQVGADSLQSSRTKRERAINRANGRSRTVLPQFHRLPSLPNEYIRHESE